MISQNLRSKILFVTWSISIGLITLTLAFTLGAAVFRSISLGGDSVPRVMRPVVETLAELPSFILKSAAELKYVISLTPSALLLPKGNITNANWINKFPAPEDDGYLLLPGISPGENQSIVQLIRVADGQVIAKWKPDWKYIHSQITGHRFSPKGSLGNYLAVHPLLLNDASLIFNTGNSLVRLPLCSSKPSWILNYPFHHSIELSPKGNSVWVPSVTEVFATDNEILQGELRDDSLSEVSFDGRILQNISFSSILSKNNQIGHLVGSTGYTTNTDPVHINQITPANSNSRYWKLGDLLISARHTSTVYLYRPITGKVIWQQQGPWLNQHSAHFVNEHAIAVFGNDVYGNKLLSPFIYKEGHNQIYMYDFESTKTEKLQSESMSRIKPMTITEGRVRVLDDLSIFVEETNNSRIFKLNSTGQLVWSFINTYNNENLGVVSWSRYITRKELQTTIGLDHLNCRN